MGKLIHLMQLMVAVGNGIVMYCLQIGLKTLGSSPTNQGLELKSIIGDHKESGICLIFVFRYCGIDDTNRQSV